MNRMKRMNQWLGCLVVACLLGCHDGPKLGQVTGTVTWEGQPLENATVTFTPDDGWSAFARTDAAGYYELKFQDGRAGATVGKNNVTLESQHFAAGGISHPEILPARYHRDSELVREVQPGKQVFDFALTEDDDTTSQQTTN